MKARQNGSLALSLTYIYMYAVIWCFLNGQTKNRIKRILFKDMDSRGGMVLFVEV